MTTGEFKRIGWAITCEYLPLDKPPVPELFAFTWREDAEEWAVRLAREPKSYKDISKPFPVFKEARP